MSAATIKLIHLLGILVVFMALGAATVHAMRGETRDTHPHRKLLGMAHGIGLLLVVGAGVGILVKNGWGLPGWVHGKILIWFLLGAALMVLGRKPASARVMAVVIPLLGVAAGALAIYKPGA